MERRRKGTGEKKTTKKERKGKGKQEGEEEKASMSSGICSVRVVALRATWALVRVVNVQVRVVAVLLILAHGAATVRTSTAITCICTTTTRTSRATTRTSCRAEPPKPPERSIVTDATAALPRNGPQRRPAPTHNGTKRSACQLLSISNPVGVARAPERKVRSLRFAW